jgi:DNA-directed RNA polymerase specialized sigma24 family protein
MTYTEIVRYAQIITRDNGLAHDIVHDLYISLKLKGIDMFDNNKPRKYIYTGLRHKAINYYKKYHSHNSYGENKQSIDVSKVAFVGEGEFEIVDSRELQDKQVIYNDLVSIARKQVSVCFWDRFHNKKKRSNRIVNYLDTHKDKYMTVFDYMVAGYERQDIAKIMKCTPEDLTSYQKYIREWTKPILKP